MKTLNIFINTFLLIVVSLTACAPRPTPTQELTPINVQLKWLHLAQFAGFYAAEQNGYYADERLKVNFIEGGQRWI